jgi:hypothetical protein
MNRVTTLITNMRSRLSRNRAGVLATLLLAGLLMVSAPGKAMSYGEEIYLGSASTGYVDVTSYVLYQYDGTTWVAGYNNEPTFQIVVDAVDGTVYDPFNNPIGICTAD